MTAPREMSSEQPQAKRRRGYLIAAAAIAVIAVVSVLVAAGTNSSSISGPVDTANLPDKGEAPALEATGWINTPPLGAGALTGKVVLYDIWTYSCINCVRTFPYIRSWYDRYRADGLVVVGVHSPEFDFEKVPGNVEDAVKRLKVTWPVALDADLTIWTAFNNKYWPADYIADRTGQLRYSHFGEGDYTNTEDVLRALLGVAPTSPRANPRTTENASGKPVNPETYLGASRGPVTQSGVHEYPPAGTLTPPATALEGSWNGDREKVTSTAPGATIAVGVHAQSVNLVLATADGKPMDVVVTLDGGPVPVPARGADIKVDANGRTFVRVTAPDMYRLLLLPGVEDHQLRVVAGAPGLEGYAFTFG